MEWIYKGSAQGVEMVLGKEAEEKKMSYFICSSIHILLDDIYIYTITVTVTVTTYILYTLFYWDWNIVYAYYITYVGA